MNVFYTTKIKIILGHETIIKKIKDKSKATNKIKELFFFIVQFLLN